MKNFLGECHSEAHNSGENLGIIMSKSGVEIASSVKAKAIVTPTTSGNTARILSVFRPDEPILAVTSDQRSERVMQLYWGVHTCLSPRVDDSESMIQNTMKVAIAAGVAGLSDKIMLIAGLPLHSPNMINTVRVLILGTVLARSNSGGCSNPEITRASGRIIHALTPEDARDKIMSSGGDILICKVLTEDYTPIIRLVSGIICEDVSEISEEQLGYINRSLVWLTRIQNAAKKLESGLTVTIDAKQLLVYEGTI
jgi:pyruvate kinase